MHIVNTLLFLLAALLLTGGGYGSLSVGLCQVAGFQIDTASIEIVIDCKKNNDILPLEQPKNGVVGRIVVVNYNKYVDLRWISKLSTVHSIVIRQSGGVDSALLCTFSMLPELHQLLILDSKFLGQLKDIGSLRHLYSLSIVNCGISEVPLEIGSLKSLKSLTLDGNSIRVFPETTKYLDSLTDLSLSSNGLIRLPSGIDLFPNLHRLDLNSNLGLDVTWMRSGRLPKIVTDLNLSGCNLNEIPLVASFVCLRSLDLSNNAFAAIPEEVTSIKSLEVLSLSGNRIKKIPAHISNLSNLRVLALDNNDISYVSDDIRLLSKLNALYIYNNKLPSQSTSKLIRLLPNTFVQIN